MLGDQIGEERGQVIVRRVLPAEGSGPRVETTFQAQGRLCDVDTNTTGTYEAAMRPDGTLFGTGQGVVMGTGGEIAAWQGNGVGHLLGDGGVSYRGAIYYQTNSPALSRLNGIAAIFEYEVDASGKTEGKIFEWK